MVVSYWNSTSNHNYSFNTNASDAVVSYWNSTSNHNVLPSNIVGGVVVSYWNSTSNHNSCLCISEETAVVSYWNSTSNHNANAAGDMAYRLYLIEILHQTTTIIQDKREADGCILLKFYIKPQLRPPCLFAIRVVSYWNSTSNHNRRAESLWKNVVVSYWNSTSNHNSGLSVSSPTALYLIEILHQTTTAAFAWFFVRRLYLIEILHQTTTLRCSSPKRPELYLIEILHQTTTLDDSVSREEPLYLIEILHQTTTKCGCGPCKQSCILLKFYIKPQPCIHLPWICGVVSYWNSTSNHNTDDVFIVSQFVVSYWNSTSNHNSGW